ncbi:MAG TPA: preprotein translocase subunit SecG [Elusimicrobiota bacterium]|nr:preprotein translocase subunit SecG [Elusimicrobiota bacterium]
MQAVVLTLHVIVCLLVILVVLIQSGKGAGLSGVFGGGGGDALFSAPSGSSFLRKLTTSLAVAFFLTSLTLTYLAARRGFRTVTRGPWGQGQRIPVQPGQPLVPGMPMMPAVPAAPGQVAGPTAGAANVPTVPVKGKTVQKNKTQSPAAPKK